MDDGWGAAVGGKGNGGTFITLGDGGFDHGRSWVRRGIDLKGAKAWKVEAKTAVDFLRVKVLGDWW